MNFSDSPINFFPVAFVGYGSGLVAAFPLVCRHNTAYLARAYENLQSGDFREAIEDAREVSRSSDRLRSQAEQIIAAAREQSFKPKDESGESQPPESKLVQMKIGDVVERVTKELTELFDIVATQDFANCQAKADIKVDGRTLVTGVPVTHLLFLEKQMTDLHTFIEKFPVLDAGERWGFDASQDCYASEPFQTTRTKKTPKSHIKYEATKEHPAQVEMYFFDSEGANPSPPFFNTGGVAQSAEAERLDSGYYSKFRIRADRRIKV